MPESNHDFAQRMRKRRGDAPLRYVWEFDCSEAGPITLQRLSDYLEVVREDGGEPTAFQLNPDVITDLARAVTPSDDFTATSFAGLAIRADVLMPPDMVRLVAP